MNIELPTESEPVRVIEGDCLDVLRSLPDGCADAVITDPPYCSGGYLEAQKNTKAQGLRGCTVAAEGFQWFTADNLGTAGLVWLLRSVLVRAQRLLAPNRSAFVFTDWRMIPNLAPALESAGMRYRNMLIWDKGSAGLGVGFKPAHEVVMEFANGSTEYEAKNGQNVLRVSRVVAGEKEHGAQKPVELLRQIIRVAVPPGGLILDPFAGSGTTGVAAALEGRRCLLIEKEPSYAAICRERIAKVMDAGLFADAS